jgi:hypothetical protein
MTHPFKNIQVNADVLPAMELQPVSFLMVEILRIVPELLLLVLSELEHVEKIELQGVGVKTSTQHHH